MSFTTPDTNRQTPLFSDNFETSAKKGSGDTDYTETTKTNDECEIFSNGMSDNDFSGKKNKFGGSAGKNRSLHNQSPEKGNMLISRFDQRIQRSLAHKMEDRCFEIAKRV